MSLGTGKHIVKSIKAVVEKPTKGFLFPFIFSDLAEYIPWLLPDSRRCMSGMTSCNGILGEMERASANHGRPAGHVLDV